MEEVLKQIFEKLTSIESGQQEQSKRLTGLESGLQEQSKRLTGLESGQQEQGKRLIAIEKTQNYHSEMFGALINAQETQKAQIDKLDIELAHLSERTDQGFTRHCRSPKISVGDVWRPRGQDQDVTENAGVIH